MLEFDNITINKLILKKQHLLEGSQLDNILNITEDICGLHATGTIEPYIQLFVRAKSFEKEDLDTELFTKKTLGKIRGMRKTLFIFTKDLMEIVYPFAKNLTEDRELKYLKYRNISLEEYGELSKQILTLLQNNEFSTSQIKQKIKTKKDLVAVISVMCDQMLLIRGKPVSSWRDRRLLYAPFKSYFPTLNLSKYTESEALTLLIERYIRSYGPVSIDDIIWWSGITKTKFNSIFMQMEDELMNIRILDLDYEYLIVSKDIDSIKKPDLHLNSVNLLPLLDPYMMGYKNRERYVDIKRYDYIFDRSGNATQVILQDGFVIGIWDVILKPEPICKLYFFEDVDDNILKIITLKAKKLAAFITGKELQIHICNSMVPLTKKNMGSFMSPLKNS
ncbi:MAG: hypothetical protein EU542_01335 [Promethearchaeota archaeon]|nr:MAG: hypothetical protein EU542_01335 [Candidatus Lokiarchaeota archaeon]